MSFVQTTGTTIPAGTVLKLDRRTAEGLVAGGNAAFLDRASYDLDLDAAARNAAAVLTFTGTTPQTLDLSALTGQVGDAAFASVMKIKFTSLDAPGSGKSVVIGNDGTAAEFYAWLGVLHGTFTLQPGQTLVVTTGETGGWTVDATHKLLKITPAAGGSLAVVIEGA